VTTDLKQLVMPTCCRCGENLNDEERDSPQLDDDGDTICDSCYDDHYCSECGRCGDVVDKSDLDTKPGALIAVWRKTDASPVDLQSGYYRVLSWPFYADGMITGYMYSNALEYFAPLDAIGSTAAKGAMFNATPMCSACRIKVAALAA